MTLKRSTATRFTTSFFGFQTKLRLNSFCLSPRQNRSWTLALALLLSAGVIPFSNGAEKIVDAKETKTPPWATAPQFEIDEHDLKRHVSFLASDAIEGRESGSLGGQAAGGYIVSELKQFGLEPAAGKDDYFQEFGNGYRNILALLPGAEPEDESTPDLSDEIIVIGAHYDHVGYGNSRNSLGPIGQIHNGADDNASGTALLLELAETLQKQGMRPRRSILFAFWDAEERGLVGSRHWVNNPTVDLKSVKFYFNYDMVGRLEEDSLEIYGSRTATGLQRRLVRHNHTPDISFVYNWDIRGDSDHFPFYLKKIPFLMLHTGKHDDYHRPSDDAHKVDYEGLTTLTRLSARLLWEEANQPEASLFRRDASSENEFVNRGIRSRKAGFTPRLGLSTIPVPDSNDRVQVRQVYSGSPAANAGLQVGDQILKFGELPIGSMAFETLVLKAESPVNVTYIRPPSTQRQKIQIELIGKPQVLGIGLYFDTAEPGSVMITHVRPGSPALIAGLEKNDIIWAIDGVWPTTKEECFEKLTSIPLEQQQINLIVEREGRLSEVKVDLWPEQKPKDN